jgi:hypothetical protein
MYRVSSSEANALRELRGTSATYPFMSGSERLMRPPFEVIVLSACSSCASVCTMTRTLSPEFESESAAKASSCGESLLFSIKKDSSFALEVLALAVRVRGKRLIHITSESINLMWGTNLVGRIISPALSYSSLLDLPLARMSIQSRCHRIPGAWIILNCRNKQS